MDLEIITESFQLDVYGFGGTAINKEYGATAFKLSGSMWEVVKANGVKNKGKNIWVYDDDHRVFAGVELENPSGDNYGLEKMTVHLEKYAYFKHIGSYSLLKSVGQRMTDEVAKRGYVATLPYVEIYGHWTPDDSKLETEFLTRLV